MTILTARIRAVRPRALLVLSALVPCFAADAQVTAPPIILKGTAPGGDVRSMSNNQNCLAGMADGSVVTLIYRQTSTTAGGHLLLASTRDEGKTWKYHPLPQNTGHRIHNWESGTMCAGRECDVIHVAWADRSSGGVYDSAYYATFNTTTEQWGAPVLLAAADVNKMQPVVTRDITVTPDGTVAVAVEVGASGGLGMGSYEGGLFVKKRGASGFSKLFPMRQGGLGWSREASIVAVDEEIHCAFKNMKGAGGIAYRSFDTASLQWQQATQIMVGPNDNGVGGLDGINAGNKSVIAKDVDGNLYILYVTGSSGGLQNNNKMRMAYTPRGKGGKNADWKDLEIIPHTATVGKNPRAVGPSDPSYPMLQGGDTSYTNYTLAPGFQGSLIVVYSKAWEDFQNKYIQIWQYGVNVPLPTKELNFWPDTEPFVFERMCGMRSTGSVGQGAWVVYGKNDKPTPGQAPNGMVRLWAATYSTARSISFGTGCQGTLQEAPRLSANDQIATLGNPYLLDFDRFVGGANLYLALGTKCSALDLGFMGAPGCELNIDFPFAVPLQVDASGKLRLQWSVPQDTNLIGAYFFSQAFVFAPGANVAGAVTSNAIRTGISL